MNRHPSGKDASPATKRKWALAFARSLNVERRTVNIRLITIALVFGITARAIVVHQVSAAFLLVPLAAELVMTSWFAVVLSRTLVDCPKFRSDNRPVNALVTTLIIGLITLLVASFTDDGRFAPNEAPAAWIAGVVELWRTGILLAVIADAAGLWLATRPDLQRWRQENGEFVWTAVFGGGVRVFLFVVLLIPSMFVVAGFLQTDSDWLQSASFRAWLTWSLLLGVELLVIPVALAIYGAVERFLPQDPTPD